MKGTWTQMFISEIIVKRQHNTIRSLHFLINFQLIHISLQGSRLDEAQLTAPEGKIVGFILECAFNYLVQVYFLIGYTEEMLSQWLKCPVKLELQVVANPRDVIYKYI